MKGLPTRPDRLKALFATTSDHDTLNLFVDPDYRDRLSHPEVRAYIRHVTEQGCKVKVWCGDMRRMFVRGDQVAAMIPRGPQRDEFISKSGQHHLTASHMFELTLEPLPEQPEAGEELTELKSAELWSAA